MPRFPAAKRTASSAARNEAPIRRDGQKLLLAMRNMGGELLAHAPERLHKEFQRRIKTQTVQPSAETAAMLSWGLLAASQITMRKMDGWQTLADKPAAQCTDLAA